MSMYGDVGNDWAQQRYGVKPPKAQTTQDWLTRYVPPTPKPAPLTPRGYSGLTPSQASRVTTPKPTPQQSDPYLDLLYNLFGRAGRSSGGGRADLTGYNKQLQFLAKERKRMKERYKKYDAAISDIYGTLTGITQSMIADIAPATEMQSAQMAATEAQQAAATREAETGRLSAATEARANLGLEDLAGEYAAGDVVTEQTEGQIADEADLSAAAQNTLAANRAIAEQAGQNQILGYALQQEQSKRDLQRSMEDALAAIRAEQSGIRAQKAQARAAAAASGSGPNIGMQLSILDRIREAETGGTAAPSFLGKFAGTSLEAPATTAYTTFADWLSSSYSSIPGAQSRQSGKATVNEALQAFRQSIPQANQWLSNPEIQTMLASYYNYLTSVAGPEY